jgi:hypothetical protein
MLKPNQINLGLMMLVAGIATGCAKTPAKSSANSDTPVVAGSIATVDQKMQGAALLQNAQGLALGKYQKTGMLAQLFGISSVEALPFNGQWDQNSSVNGLNWQPVSIKEYLGQSLDSNFVNPNGSNNTVFGRFRSTARMLCAFDYLIPQRDANQLPADGTYSLTLKVGPGTQLSEKCAGFENEAANSFSVTITVSTPADTSVYMKKIELGGINQGGMGAYLTVNDKFIRIAGFEIESATGRSRDLMEYDRANDVLRFEYLSQQFASDGGAELQRIYIDGKNEKALLLSYSGTSAQSNFQLNFRFIAAGSPVDAKRTSIAVSVGVLGQQIADQEGLNACINATNGSLMTDDSLDCQTTGIDITTASGIAASFSAHNQASDITVSETMTPAFHDATDFATAVSQ